MKLRESSETTAEQRAERVGRVRGGAGEAKAGGRVEEGGDAREAEIRELCEFYLSVL